MNNIIETSDELEDCNNCNWFSFNGQIHKIKVTKCYDGDTLYCNFKHDGQYQQFKIRLLGYDSPEMKIGKNVPKDKREVMKKKALEAKHKLESLVMDKHVYLICHNFDKYGRILGTIKINLTDDKSVNDIMIEENYGYAYDGGAKKKI